MSNQLLCSDLKKGDILLKVNDGGAVNKLIATGQKIFENNKNSPIVHAGIMYDNNQMIEADGTGVSIHELLTDNYKYGYIVFRCKDNDIASGAAEFAKILWDFHKNNKKLKYTVWGAFTSLFKSQKEQPKTEDLENRVEKILTNKKEKVFCSQLVVFVYQFAAEQKAEYVRTKLKAPDIFKTVDKNVSPSYLAYMLVNNKALFEEAGYLMAGAR